ARWRFPQLSLWKSLWNTNRTQNFLFAKTSRSVQAARPGTLKALNSNQLCNSSDINISRPARASEYAVFEICTFCVLALSTRAPMSRPGLIERRRLMTARTSEGGVTLQRCVAATSVCQNYRRVHLALGNAPIPFEDPVFLLGADHLKAVTFIEVDRPH